MKFKVGDPDRLKKVDRVLTSRRTEGVPALCAGRAVVNRTRKRFRPYRSHP
jgi:hypothetical protein